MASLTIDNVQKRYGPVEILKGIDIAIDDGEFLVLVGPSGCGKSTLLSMIAGLDTIIGRRDPHRRAAGQRAAPQGPRHRHGVPVLRALPEHDRGAEHLVRPRDARRAEGPSATAPSPAWPSCSRSSPCLSRKPAPALGRAAAARGDGPRTGAPARRSSCSTSRSRTSTPSSGSRCAPRSRSCTSGSRPPSSTSPTTRSRR